MWIGMMVAAVLGATGAHVSLLTAMPGEEVFQLEGHTALRIVDDSGHDYVVNWGVFDFNSPNFIYRFVAGDTDYLCMAYPTDLFFQEYAAEGREVVEQVLALDSLQTAKLTALVTENLQPENRIYRYNYVLDNCATRPLALIEAAVGRQLLGDDPTATSFRAEMKRFHSAYPWYQFGIDMALGRRLDRPISRRQTAFAPVTLMAELDRTDIVSGKTVYGRQTIQPKRTPWLLTPLAVALAVLALAIAVCFCGRKAARRFDSLLFGVFFIGGCILTFLVFVSSHEATSPNLLLLWLNPFCLAGVILPWIKSAKKAEMCYFFANFALLILLAVLAPLLGRDMNVAFWPLIAADAVRSIARIRQCLHDINHS